ncbi:MAG: DUF91 domain-containing protein [Nitrospiraceae bacterium]|nr:DUF91 domain-containing protein [Nitrospiraceae bacterium]
MVHMLLSPPPIEGGRVRGYLPHGAGARNSVLIVVGCCSVKYVGRARSTLGWDERIVIQRSGVLATRKVQ